MHEEASSLYPLAVTLAITNVKNIEGMNRFREFLWRTESETKIYVVCTHERPHSTYTKYEAYVTRKLVHNPHAGGPNKTKFLLIRRRLQ